MTTDEHSVAWDHNHNNTQIVGQAHSPGRYSHDVLAHTLSIRSVAHLHFDMTSLNSNLVAGNSMDNDLWRFPSGMRPTYVI